MSWRTKVAALSPVLFAPVALIILTGARPSSLDGYISSWGRGPWAQLGHQTLVFSLIGDGLAWLTCLALCLLIGRLAYRLRDRMPFGLTLSILALFIVCFGLQRLMGYAFWTPLNRIGPELEIIRAAALVVVAMGSAVLYPYVRTMFEALISANQDHEKFLVAAEGSLDAFYILESVRDDAKKIVDFRFSYVNANGEQRFGKQRTELLGKHLSEMLPYMVSTGLLERYKQVVQTGLPFTEEHQVEREGTDSYWIVMQVVKLGDGVAVTNRDVTEERAALHQIANLNEFTQSMIENAPFSIIATDPAGTVTAMNAAAESLTL